MLKHPFKGRKTFLGIAEQMRELRNFKRSRNCRESVYQGLPLEDRKD
jgi:hypothetical protein